MDGEKRAGEEAWNWRRDGLSAGVLWVLCLGLRVWTWPASFWEWDEINFARAIERFDLPAHRPHPPGFPIFVLLARAAHSVVGRDHTALLVVNLLLGSLLGVALYLVFREVLRGRASAFGAALLSCGIPALWLPSLMARSDLPAMVTGLFVVGLLLRGRHSPRAYLCGAGLLGLGMGIRVTIAPLAAGVLTWVFLTWARRRQWRLTGGAIGLALTGYLSWYLPILLQTGWEAHRALTRTHSRHLIEHDSLWSSYWTLGERLTTSLVTVWGTPLIMWVVYGASGLGILVLLRRREAASLGWLALIFAPYLLFTFTLNSPMGMVFYILPGLPLFTGLAAVGLTGATTWKKDGRAEAGGVLQRGLRWLGGAVIVGLVLLIGYWMEPVVTMLRRQASPPAQAMQELTRRLDPTRDKVSHQNLLLPHVRYWLETARTEEWIPEEAPGLNLIDPDNRPVGRHYLLSTQPVESLSHRLFRWSSGTGRDRLRPLSLGRYLEVYLTEWTRMRNHTLLDGWYPRESTPRGSWQWMGKSGSVALFHEAPRMRLRLRGQFGGTAEQAKRTTLTVRLEGREIARWTGPTINEELVIPEPTSGHLWSVLYLEASESFVPRQILDGTDDRELGFRCTELTWQRTGDAVARVFGENHFLGEGWQKLNKGKPRSWRRGGPLARVQLPALPAETDGELRAVADHPGGEGRLENQLQFYVGGEALRSLPQPVDRVLIYRVLVPRRLHQGRPIELEIRAAKPVAGDDDVSRFRLTSLGWLPASRQSLAIPQPSTRNGPSAPLEN